MSADAHGHEKGPESKGSPIEKGVSWLMRGFTGVALSFAALVGLVGIGALGAIAVKGLAVAATKFFAGSVVMPNYMLAAAIGTGMVAGNIIGKSGKEAPKKEKPAAHGAAHH